MFKFRRASNIEKLLSALESSASFYDFLARHCENPFMLQVYRAGIARRREAVFALQDFIYHDPSAAALQVDEHRIRSLRESYLLVMRLYTGDDMRCFAKDLLYTEKLLTGLFSANLLMSRRSDLTSTIAVIVQANRRFQLRLEAVTTATC